MFDWLLIIVAGVILIASILDVKYKAVPSVLLTGTIFAVLMLRPENLLFGVLSLVFGLLMRDLTEFGVADIKILVIIGLMVTGLWGFFGMIFLFITLQSFYIIILRLTIKKKGEVPFIPCLFGVYLSLLILGGIA